MARLPGLYLFWLAARLGFDHEVARAQGGLNGLNFFVGALQTAFGPFFTVYLTQKGWSQVDIGFALSIGTGCALSFRCRPARWGCQYISSGWPLLLHCC